MFLDPLERSEEEDFCTIAAEDRIQTKLLVESKRQGKHTIDRFNRSGFAAFTTIDGMTTVPASSRIGLGAKWKNSEGAR